ncbi:MAG: putative porin, partial [Bacteroidota bacterium]
MFFSYSQTFYSTDSKYLRTKSEKNNLLSNYKYGYPDTSVNNIHNYFPRNFLGNIGLPTPTYSLTYGTNNLGFNFYTPPYQNDIYTENQVEYFRSKGPYANLIGIAGSKKFQAFKMLFTQTYKDRINITLKFSRYTSQGYYLKQQSYTNNFYISSNSTSKNNRLGYYFYLIVNGNKNKENGGLKIDSLTDATLLKNKEILAVRLTGANRENKEIKAMFNPYVRLNKKQDSTTRLNQFIQLKSMVSSNTYKYKSDNDNIDKYYTITYLDTTKTRDSSRVIKIINEINYSAITTNSNFAVSFGYKNELNQVWQKADSLFYNHIANAEMVYRKSIKPTDSLKTNGKEIETYFNFQYILNGANAGNYKAETRTILSYNKANGRLLYFNLLAENRSADYIYNYWISNHFSWFNNRLEPQQQLQAVLGFNLNKVISSSVFIQNINNYLFFDNVALPQQYSKTITNLGLRLNFTKVFLKHIGVTLNYVFQNTSNATYVRLPQNQGTAKLFYTGILFKNNLHLQIGGQLQAYQS